LRLGQVQRAWPLLKHSPYPEARSRLIHRLAPGGVDAGVLVEQLHREKEVSIRRALILALGEYKAEQMPTSLRERVIPTLRKWYRDDPDPGIRSAIDWLLRHAQEGPTARPLDWGQAPALDRIDRELAQRGRAERAAALTAPVAAANPGLPALLTTLVGHGNVEAVSSRGGRAWYVNSQGQTLAVIESFGPFLMGSPPHEPIRYSEETQHWRRIGRRYALGTKLLTVEQFQRFLEAHPEIKPALDARERDAPRGAAKLTHPELQCPVITLNWYEAAQYCRWLSELEGVPEHEMVFPPFAVLEKCKAGKPVPVPANYLNRTGYRLPTEAEWEFACRAETRTSRYYGSSRDLLPRYAWFHENSQERTWPVGQKKPNDFGLFDMHGNVWTWCLEGVSLYPAGSRAKPARDQEQTKSSAGRVVRGSSFRDHHWLLRSAARANWRVGFSGLRVARTCYQSPD
jgi:formylglycine-generating enzyme required for sulfatase activity